MRKPISQSLVIAYHGCDQSVGEKLITGDLTRLNWSRNTYDWIGGGVYFFENDYDRALHFAETVAQNPEKKLSQDKIKVPFVVGAVIDLGHCLDLSRQEGIREAADAFEALELAKLNKLPKNEASFEGDKDFIKRKLDRAIIEHLHKLRADFHGQLAPSGGYYDLPPYDTVRSPFAQGDPIGENSAFKRYSHVQLAVRNVNSIIGYFLPKNTVPISAAFKQR